MGERMEIKIYPKLLREVNLFAYLDDMLEQTYFTNFKKITLVGIKLNKLDTLKLKRYCLQLEFEDEVVNPNDKKDKQVSYSAWIGNKKTIEVD